MANVTIDFKGFEKLRTQIHELGSKPVIQSVESEAVKDMAAVYLGEAKKNTPVGGIKEVQVTKKTYKSSSATEFKKAKDYNEAKKESRQAFIKRVKKSKSGPQYLISATSEHMRRSWGVGPVRVGAKDISVEVFNSASYASYVNDGHRQKPGRYVPILGKRLVKGWVDGLFMAEKAEKKTSKAAKRIINRRIELYLKGVMK